MVHKFSFTLLGQAKQILSILPTTSISVFSSDISRWTIFYNFLQSQENNRDLENQGCIKNDGDEILLFLPLNVSL